MKLDPRARKVHALHGLADQLHQLMDSSNTRQQNKASIEASYHDLRTGSQRDGDHDEDHDTRGGRRDDDCISFSQKAICYFSHSVLVVEFIAFPSESAVGERTETGKESN